jgi:hypothetical protein
MTKTAVRGLLEAQLATERAEFRRLSEQPEIWYTVPRKAAGASCAAGDIAIWAMCQRGNWGEAERAAFQVARYQAVMLRGDLSLVVAREAAEGR